MIGSGRFLRILEPQRGFDGRSDLQAGRLQNAEIVLTESVSIQVIERNHSGGSAFALKWHCQRGLQVVQDHRIVCIATFDRHVSV